MSEVNKAELRRLANEATETEMEWPDATLFGRLITEDWADYAAAASPAAVLALLDEVEALQGLYRMHQQTETREMRDLKTERDQLRAAQMAYASEFAMNEDGEPDVGSIHANIKALRTCLRETAAVSITMLYDTHRDDVLKTFTIPDLNAVVEASVHLADANTPVEQVYRKAWDLSVAKDGGANG